jgi:hypothetical protein
MIVDDARVAAAAASVSTKLASHEGDGELPKVIESAVTTLTRLDGINEPLAEAEVPAPPPWMSDMIAQRRDYEQLYERYMRYVRWRRKIPIFGRGARRTDQ